jgi:hypothetical protein
MAWCLAGRKIGNTKVAAAVLAHACGNCVLRPA